MTNNAERGFSDRAQRAAFWACFIGAFMNAFMCVMYAINDGVSTYLIINAAFYMIPLSMICYSSYFNWHFRRTLEIGVGSIFLYMWGTTLYDANTGNGSILSYPILLFIPYFLFIVTRFELLIFYAFVHSALTFFYGNYFMADVFGFDPVIVDTTALSLILSTMSGSVLLVFAIVAYSRKKTDRRLLNLVRETERLAEEDALTGLKNRRAFRELVEGLWNNATPFVMVFFDLDRFKPINDEFGHTAGDNVLQTIGHRLNTLMELDIKARLGGDEFAVLIKEPSRVTDIQEIVESLHRAIIAPIDIDGTAICVGASLGYARAYEHAKNPNELIDAAETAMRRCKLSGSGIASFNPNIDDTALASSIVQDRFRRALIEGDLKPALQPIVDGKTRKIVGYEMLTRWENSGLARDPSPLEFIPVAERLGLLNDLLWSTLETALDHMSRRPGFLAINVSPSQLLSRSFISDLVKITDRFQFDMKRIEIEVTEHVAFRNLAENIRVLSEARDLGCRIVLDDFGAGYSSLSLLEELPLDKVKLDKSLQRFENKGGVLQATIALTTRLGFECCVEGIESEQAAEFASSEGCCQMQGYLFGRPRLLSAPPNRLKMVS